MIARNRQKWTYPQAAMVRKLANIAEMAIVVACRTLPKEAQAEFVADMAYVEILKREAEQDGRKRPLNP